MEPATSKRRPAFFPIRKSGAAWLAGLLALTGPAPADDSFMRVEAITISATDQNYDGWINLLAFGNGRLGGPLAPLSQGGPAATPPKFTDIMVHKRVDAHSPKLMTYCANGKHIPKVQIDFVRTSGSKYATLTLEDALITSYSFLSVSAGEMPTETVSFNFTKIEISVMDRLETGIWETMFDIRTGALASSFTKIGNNPPKISAVETRLGTEGSPHVFSVTVEDDDSPLDSLVLTGESDNPALLPASAFSFSGAGGVREVTLRPVPGIVGLAHASLAVSDGMGSSSVFFLAVFSPAQGSDIRLEPRTVQEHAAAGTAVGLLTAVPPSPLGPPTFELLDSAAGRFRLDGDTLVVNDPFLLDFETAPRPRVTVRVIDAAGNPERSAQLTVEVVDVAEGAFDAWRRIEFSSDELLDPNVSGPDADPDRDRLNNLVEYALGTPPKNGANGPLPQVGKIDVGGTQFLTLTYRQRTELFDPDLLVMPEISQDLGAWLCGPAHFVVINRQPVGASLEEVTVRSTRATSDALREHVRLRVLR